MGKVTAWAGRYVFFILVLGSFQIFSQSEWKVERTKHANWVLRKQSRDNEYERFFAVAAIGIPKQAQQPTVKTNFDSTGYIEQTKNFNLNFLGQSAEYKPFLAEKPIVTGWTDIHYLWYQLDGKIDGLGTFNRNDHIISYEEMQAINSAPDIFSNKIIQPVMQNLTETFTRLSPNSDKIWFLNDEPDRGLGSWYWSPDIVKLFHEEAKKLSPSSLTFVDLGPVEGSLYLYDYYLHNQLQVSLPDSLKNDNKYGDGTNYATYCSSSDGHQFFKWTPYTSAKPDSGRYIAQPIDRDESIIRRNIQITTKAYEGTADILGVNSYGYFNANAKNVATVADAMREVVPDKPLWFFFQAFEANNPGIKSMRSQVYAAIIHGVTGILFYNNDNSSTPFWSEIQDLSKELKQNEDLIRSETVAYQLEGDIQYVIKSYAGQRYLISVNFGDSTCTLTLNGFPTVSMAHDEVVVLPATQVNDHIVINELMVSNSVLPDEDGQYNSWIELYNPTNKIIQLSGMTVSIDTLSSIGSWQIRDHVLEPMGYTVIWLSGKDKKEGSHLHADFTLGTNASYLLLKDKNGMTIDFLSLENVPGPNESIGRNPNNMFDWIHYQAHDLTSGTRNATPGFWRKKINDIQKVEMETFFAVLNWNEKIWAFGISADPVNSAARRTSIWLSEDGLKWTLANSHPPFSSNSSMVSFQNKLWAFDCSDVWSSVNGLDWKREASPQTACASSPVSFHTALWAIHGNTIRKSQDGINWIDLTLNAPWANQISEPHVMIHNERMFAFVANYDSTSKLSDSSNSVWSSADGFTWSLETKKTEWQWRQGFTTISFDNRIWVMGGDDGKRNYNDVWVSVDGKHWGEIVSEIIWSPRSRLLSYELDNSLFVSCGKNEKNNFLRDIWTCEKKYDLRVAIDSIKIFTYGDDWTKLTDLQSTKISCSRPDILEIENANVRPRNVGTTTVTLSFKGDEKWYPSQHIMTIIVTPKPVIVSVADTFKTYGDPNPQFELKYVGLIRNDMVADFQRMPSVICEAGQFSPVGKYSVTTTGGMATNYIFISSPSWLTIKARKLEVKVAKCSKIYGEPNPEFQVQYSGFAANETASDLKNLPHVVTNAATTADVGVYELKTAGGYSKNYEFIHTLSFFEIKPKDLTIIPVDTFKIFGEPNPQVAIRYTGFISGEGPGDLTGEVTIETNATEYSPVGDYVLTVVGGNSNNYRISRLPGTLHVKSREGIIVFPNPVVDNLNIITPINAGLSDFIVIYSADNLPIIKQELITKSNNHQIGLHHFPPGLYYYSIMLNSKITSGKFILK
jgi:hypothetical protein